MRRVAIQMSKVCTHTGKHFVFVEGHYPKLIMHSAAIIQDKIDL